MRIDLPATLLPPGTARAAALTNWKIDQLLTAEVIGTTRENSTRLRIGDQIVDARSHLPLQRGQTLRLQVVAMQPTIVLKAHAPVAGTAPGSVERGLARSLPRQGTLTTTLGAFRALDSVAKSPAAAVAGTGHTVAQRGEIVARVADLLRSLPNTRELAQPAALRAAVVSAATPLEAKLAAAATTNPASARLIAEDLRAQLGTITRLLGDTRPVTPAPVAEGVQSAKLMMSAHGSPSQLPALEHKAVRLAEAEPPIRANIAPAPTEELTVGRIRELLDSQVARIQTHQYAGLQHSVPQGLPLVVDLPVRHGEHIDAWHFEFVADDADPPPGGTPEPALEVSLTLQFEPRHAVRAYVRMVGDTVSVRLAAELTELNTLFIAHRDELADNLTAQGLEVARISVGEVPASRHLPMIDKRLIDDLI